jgi:hypothetical protein
VSGRRRAIIAAVVLAAVVVGGNVVAYAHNGQVDLSAARRFSLAPETRAVTDQVRSPLKVIAFLNRAGPAARDARFLLARYHELNRRITSSVVDPDAEPGEARRYGISKYSTVVLTYRGVASTRRRSASSTSPRPSSVSFGGAPARCVS